MKNAPSLIIRAEMEGEQRAISLVHERAFGRPQEARVVERLRVEAQPYVALVAALDACVVGHICFSPVAIDDTAVRALGLAPMAVAPELQNRGIGSRLVEAGLAACRARDYRVVVVLGHPRFYPRFGFTPASGKGLRCEWPVPDEAFMVLELEPGALAGVTGLVRYLPVFAADGEE